MVYMEITQLIAVLQEMAQNNAALMEAVLTISVCVCVCVSIVFHHCGFLSSRRIGWALLCEYVE